MPTVDAQRHRMIKKAVLQRPEAMLDVTIDLWERLASELIAIIGEGGFQSLHARSVHVTGVTYPWIVRNQPSPRTDDRFASLRMSLDGRDFPEASEASIALMITFVDILALLIGEHLTTSILGSAWGDDAVELAEKELRE